MPRRKGLFKRSQKQKEHMIRMHQMRQARAAATESIQNQDGQRIYQMDVDNADAEPNCAVGVEKTIDPVENVHVEVKEEVLEEDWCDADYEPISEDDPLGNTTTATTSSPTSTLPISFLQPIFSCPLNVSVQRGTCKTKPAVVNEKVGDPQFDQSHIRINNVPSSRQQQRNCLLCFEKIDSNSKTPAAATNISESNFQPMFILKKMLSVPSCRLSRYLQIFGNPCDWLSFCKSCKVFVDQAMTIQKKIGRLEDKLRNCQQGMLNIIRGTWKRSLEKPSRSKKLKFSVQAITTETREFVCLDILKLQVKSKRKGLHRRSQKQKENLELGRLSRLKKLLARKAIQNNSQHHDEQTRQVHLEKDPTTGVQFSVTTVENVTEMNSLWSSTGSYDNYSSYDNCEVEEDQNAEGSYSPSSPQPESSHTMTEYREVADVIDVSTKRQLTVTGYRCVLCPTEGDMPLPAYISHRLFHYKRSLKCSECGLYFSNAEELENSPFASSANNNSETPVHSCSKDTLIDVPFDHGNIWSCSGCSEKFKLDTVRDEHEQSCNPNVPELKHKCRSCSKSLRNLAEWLLHRLLEHPELAEFSCPYCEREFKCSTKEGIDICQFKELNEHMKTRHKYIYVNPPDNCDFCGAIFWSSNSLCQHMEEAHGLKQDTAYSCNICYIRKSRRVAINKHIYQVHANVNRKHSMFICEICGHTITRVEQNSLQPPIEFEEHKFEKHGILPQSNRSIRSCTKEGCTFQTLLPRRLSRHMMKEHEATRKHVCKVCGKGFFTPDFLRRHEEIHVNANLKPFQCEICGNSFAVKNYLYIHMRLSHQNRPFASTHKKKPPRRKPKTFTVPNTANSTPKVASDSNEQSTDLQATVQSSHETQPDVSQKSNEQSYEKNATTSDKT